MLKKSKKKKEISDVVCQSIGKSIAEILQFSLSEDFQKQAFTLFSVFSTKQVEKEIIRRLSIIKNNELNSVHKKNKFIKSTKVRMNCADNHVNYIKKCSQNISNSISPADDVSSLSPNIYNNTWLKPSTDKYTTFQEKKNCSSVHSLYKSSYSQPLKYNYLENKSILDADISFSHSLNKGYSSCSNEDLSTSNPYKFQKLYNDSKIYFKENLVKQHSCHF